MKILRLIYITIMFLFMIAIFFLPLIYVAIQSH
jgi:hypothetical protein